MLFKNFAKKIKTLYLAKNDTMVLNMDDIASYSGLVRNFEGNFEFFFYGSVGLSNILHAEIHAFII